MQKIRLLYVGDRFVKKCPADESNQSLLTIVEEDGVRFAAFLDDEIAEQIVRACNCHDELLAALKMMNHAYVRLLETGRDRIIDYGGECDSVELMESMSSELRQSKAAITKAEGT